MSTRVSLSKFNGVLSVMQQELKLIQRDLYEREMEKRWITSDRIGKVLSTISELRSSLEKQIERDSRSETGAKIDKRPKTWIDTNGDPVDFHTGAKVERPHFENYSGWYANYFGRY